MLGKPIAESNALFVPTGIYPFAGGAEMAFRATCGKVASPLCELGWKSLGLLELTALDSISKDAWVPALEAADALLVWGGDVLYLSYWMKRSGLADLFATRRPEFVYVGVSAGSMAVSSTFAEACSHPRTARHDPHTAELVVMQTANGAITRTVVTAEGAGLVDFALIPHLDHAEHPDASSDNARIWASRLTAPVYAIDDQTAIKVVGGTVEVVSQGRWQLLNC
jgi:dipeptidase E